MVEEGVEEARELEEEKIEDKKEVSEEEKKEEKEEEIEEEIEEEKPTPEIKPRIKGKKRGVGKIPSYVLEMEEISEDEKIYERIMTIRFFPKLLSAPKWKRAKKAAKLLREFVDKYVKYAPHPETGNKVRLIKRRIWIHPKVNEEIWSRGAKNPPRRIRVKVVVRALPEERGRPEGLPVELRIMPI